MTKDEKGKPAGGAQNTHHPMAQDAFYRFIDKIPVYLQLKISKKAQRLQGTIIKPVQEQFFNEWDIAFFSAAAALQGLETMAQNPEYNAFTRVTIDNLMARLQEVRAGLKGTPESEAKAEKLLEEAKAAVAVRAESPSPWGKL